MKAVTKSELNAWYSFGVSAGPMAATTLGVLSPLILQSFAEAEAYSHSNPLLRCDSTGPCDIKVGPFLVETNSLVLYSTSLSVFIQMILFISLGSMADYGNYRKKFMLMFGYLTAASAVGFGLVLNTKFWPIVYILAIVMNVCFGASFVFCYAYQAVLTENHPRVLGGEDVEMQTYEKGSKVDAVDAVQREKISEIVGNEISGKFTAYEAISGVGLLVLSIMYLITVKSGKPFGLPDVYPMQVCVLVTGLYQFLILIFFTSKIEARPGKALPAGESYLSKSLRDFRTTLSKASELPELFKFLLAWFFYSDSFTTVVSVAILFASSSLKADKIILLISAAIVPLFMFIGVYFWGFVQSSLRLTTLQILLIQSVLYSLLPIYGLLGFFNQTIGLVNQYELLFVGAFHGLLLGATQSSTRVLFQVLIPPGHESQFFGLYEITDKGSSWVGPLIVGLITNVTGNIRYSFVFIALMFLIPVYLFSRIDVQKGSKDAQDFK